MEPTENILQLASEGRAVDMWRECRRRSLTSLYYFSKVVCAYNLLVPHFHMPLCNDIQNTVDIRKRGYLWPRKHFKSTIIAKSYPHWRLIGGGQLEKMPELLDLSTPELLKFYTMYPERDPRNLRIGIIGESADVAEKDLKDIKDRTMNSEFFRWLFPEIIPDDVKKGKWTESEIILPRSKSFDESTISCKGVGAKGTGFHYDILIYDDIIGEAASQSEAIMKDALDWLKAAPGLLNDDITGEELIAGTRWKDGTADVYGWLMKEMPFTPGVDGEPATGFKMSTQSCYIEPTKEIRFKERFNTTIMEEIRKRAGDYLFNCNYRNMPTPPEGSKFAGIKYYSIEKDGDGNYSIAVPEDGSPSVHINQLGRVSFYDPSAGGKTAACDSAIGVAGMDAARRLFLIDMWSANTTYSGAIEHWHVMNDKYRCWKNCYEQVGHQKEVGDIVTLRNIYGSTCIFCQQKHRALVPNGVKPPPGIHKQDRINLYLEHSVAEGRVYVQRKHAEVIRQATMFPNGDKVDELDVLAYLAHESLPYRGIEEQMDEKQAQQERAQHSQRCAGSRNAGGYV